MSKTSNLEHQDTLTDNELDAVTGGTFDIGNIVSGIVKATTVVVASEPPKIGFLGW